jgi:Flp pilus assembly protein TadG
MGMRKMRYGRTEGSGPTPGSPRCVRRRFGSLLRDRGGATMVEFALIALPFFLLLFGGFEIGFVYWATEELENATSHGARMVRTGQVQTGRITQAALKTQICNQTAILVGCTSRLRIDIRSATTFAALTPPTPLDGAGALKDDSDFSFDPGDPNDVIIVSAFYSWTPILNPSDYILRASSITRNEPF